MFLHFIKHLRQIDQITKDNREWTTLGRVLLCCNCRMKFYIFFFFTRVKRSRLQSRELCSFDFANGNTSNLLELIFDADWRARARLFSYAICQNINFFRDESLYLVQVDFGGREPFADEDHHRSTLSVHSALIQTTDSRDFGQVFRFRSPEEPFVPEINDFARLVK